MSWFPVNLIGMRTCFLLLLLFTQTIAAETVSPRESDGSETPSFQTTKAVSNPNATAAFLKKLNKLLSKCAPGCEPITPWFKGDKHHCADPKGSCHNSGEAVDIHRLKCRSGTFSGREPSGKKQFTAIVNCMDRNGAVTLWQVPNHYSHFHINFPGCNKKVGCG